jgi:putative transposase
MSTFTQILYHIVFSTKDREPTLSIEKRPEVFKYVWGVIQKKNSNPYWINGVEDHLHIATHIHPTVALSPLIKDIKLASNSYIEDNRILRDFGGWQNGYAAFTCSHATQDNLIQYIRDQENHHMKISFKDELIALLKEHGVEFNERFLL